MTRADSCILAAMGNHAEISTLAQPRSRGVFSVVWGALATAISVGWTAIFAPLAALSATIGKTKWVTEVTRAWAWLIIKTCGVRVDIQGLENVEGLGPFVLVSNHQSFFDIFAIVSLMPGDYRFIAKKELLKIPVVGYAMQKGDHIMIDREAGGKEIRKVVAIARKGYHVAVFAEGHRFNDNRVHEFEQGAAWLAILTRLPVVPMAISGSGAFFPRLARVVIPGGTMRMRLGKPIPTADLKSSDREQLTQQLESAVRAMFETEVR